MNIKLEKYFPVSNPDEFRVHIATQSNGTEPLDVFHRDWDEWVGWNEYRKEDGKDAFPSEYIFSIIKDSKNKDRYVFGGIFKIINRFGKNPNEIGYKVRLEEMYKDLIGRLIITYSRPQAKMGRSFILKNIYSDFYLSEILEESKMKLPHNFPR